MRECPKCGKANQPTRKFCIRCAASLLAPRKPATISQPTPVAPAPQPTAQPTAPPQAPQAASDQALVTTEDQWVRPSEISKDRVRTASGAKRKTELEKAREAFDRAENVGIEEAAGSGIVESRMLRASEVRELLEQTAEYSAAEVQAPTLMEGSEPLPPDAAHLTAPAMPTPADVEHSILGAKSTLVEQPTSKPSLTVAEVTPQVPPALGDEFASTRYDSAPAPAPVEVAPPITPTPAPAEVTPSITPAPIPKAPAATAAPKTPATPAPSPPGGLENVTTCTTCGSVINVDLFEYPKEVYGAMGGARLKQARFLVVQGKYEDARHVARISRFLYMKAEDKNGLTEVGKLVDSLTKKA